MECPLRNESCDVLEGENSSAVPEGEHKAKTQTNLNSLETSVESMRLEIRKYGEQKKPKPRAMKEILIRMENKLLREFKTDVKIPILSENVASRELLSRSKSEIYKMLDNLPLDGLEPDEIRLSYWYWSLVAKGSQCEIDDEICFSVTIKGKKNKPREMRPSWVLPLRVIVEETRYAFPLIDCLKRGEFGLFTSYTLSNCQTCMLELDENSLTFLRYRYPGGHQIIIINYSVFDAVVPNWIIKICFKVLMKKFDFFTETQEDESEKKVEALKNSCRFKMMVKYFRKLPIKMRTTCDDSFKVQKARGIPIGSCFTNVIRTMSNFIMTRIVCSTFIHEEPCLQRFHGSKCMLTYESSVEFNKDVFCRRAKMLFGIVVNKERTCVAANMDDLHKSCSGFCCDTDEDD